MNPRADIVVCGAGVAGVATAYHLAVRHGVRNVVLVDERDPFTLTSDKGTQGYRNWWPGPDDTMLKFVSRSIDLMEEMADETNNLFRLNRRGYLFVSSDENGAARMLAAAQQVSGFGMGPVRQHRGSNDYRPAPAEGFLDQPDGADFLVGDDALHAFPFLSRDTKAALHIRRAGWLNAIALGAWMFRQCIAAGVTFVRGRVDSIGTTGGRVSSVRLTSGQSIETHRVAIAAGPMLPDFAQMLGVDLPLIHELHAKVTVSDERGVIPRSAPFTIWIDPVRLGASIVPGGLHARPVDGPRGDELWLIWTYHTKPTRATWPPTFDRRYGETCVRGLGAAMPAAAAHLPDANSGVVDGGYYCKTSDNRPLVGPLPVEGAYVIGALSGIGIMSSHSAADLLAAHLTQSALPSYASAFLPSRYDDPEYIEQVERWGALTGQL